MTCFLFGKTFFTTGKILIKKNPIYPLVIFFIGWIEPFHIVRFVRWVWARPRHGNELLSDMKYNLLVFLLTSTSPGKQMLWCSQEPSFQSSLAYLKVEYWWHILFIRNNVSCFCVMSPIQDQFQTRYWINFILFLVALQDFFFGDWLACPWLSSPRKWAHSRAVVNHEM